MNKNLTVKIGNCNHRRYLPKLMDLVADRRGRPDRRSSPSTGRPTSAIEAYQTFDRRQDGWLKTVLDVA